MARTSPRALPPALVSRGFDAIEILEDRIAPAFTVTYTGTAPNLSLRLDGTASDDIATFALLDAATLQITNTSPAGGPQLVDLTGVTSIVVNGLAGNDAITLNLTGGAIATSARTFSFVGGGNTGDTLAISGNGTQSATWVPGAASAGTVTIGGSIYNYASTTGGLILSSLSAVSVQTGAGADSYTLAATTLTSSSPAQKLTFASVPALTIDLGVGDGSTATADTLTVTAVPAGVTTLSVLLGAGDDRLNVSGINSLTGFTFTADGGSGSDTLAFTADLNITLLDGGLGIPTGTLGLNSTFEIANLTGGASDNVFDIGAWSGTGSVTGGSGTDKIVQAGEAFSSYGLNDSQLTRIGSVQKNISLSSVEQMDITARSGSGALTIINGFTGSATYRSVGGNDQLVFNLTGAVPTGGTVNFIGSGAGDYMWFFGNGTSTAEWTPDGTASHTGALTYGGLALTYSGVGLDFQVMNGVGALLVRPGSGASNYSVSGNTISSTTPAHKAILTGSVGALTIDLGGNDASAAVDTLTIATLPSFASSLAVLTGAGNDTVTFQGGVSYTGYSAFNLDGGTGADTLAVTADTSFTLSNAALSFSLGGNAISLNLNSTFEVANLSGGTGANSFTVSDWTGTGTLDGLAGSDSLVATNDVTSFTLANSSFARTGLGTLTLANLEGATLTGGVGANSFTVSGWTGAGVISGLGGVDTLIASSNVATFTLTDSSLARTGLGALTLSEMEAATLTGGASANIFDISGWSGTASLVAAAGNDTVAATHNIASFTLTNTSLLRSGLGTITLAGVTTANLTGGAVGTTFNVSGWTGNGALNGGGGSAALAATNNAGVFTLSDTSFARSGQGTFALSGIATANLTGGNSANIFDISGWKGTGAITGSGGANTVQATSDAALFTLTDTSLTRTGFGTMALSGISTANLTGGPSANRFDVTGWSGTGTIRGISGNDTLVDAHNVAAYVLADTSLVRTGLGTLTLHGVSAAQLSSAAAAVTFTVGAWTGSGSLTAGAGHGGLVADNASGTITLTDASFARTNTGTLTLSGLQTATVIGSGGNDLFDLSGWTGAATISGGVGGQDSLRFTNDVAGFFLTDASLGRTGYPAIALARFTSANLTGGPGDNTFDLSGWKGTATLTGGGGSDTVSVTNDAASFVLQDTSLARTGSGFITLAGIAKANLTGGPGANTFTVSSWTGGGAVDGLGGNDTLIIAADLATITLSDGQLLRAGLPAMALANLEHANLTGGASDNSFDLTGWSGSAALDGAGGFDDTFAAAGDSTLFTLSDTKLARTGRADLALANLEIAILKGGAGDNAFDISGWSRSGQIFGGSGANKVIQAGGSYTTFDLSGAALVRNVALGGPWTFALAGISEVEITAPDGENWLTVNSDFAGKVTYHGRGGNDHLTVNAAATAAPRQIIFDGDGGQDELYVAGDSAAAGTWAPSGSIANDGTFFYAGTTVTYHEVPAGLTIFAVSALVVQPGAGASHYYLTGDTITSLTPAQKATFSGGYTLPLSFELGASDIIPAPDSLTIVEMPQDIVSLHVALGAGDDQVIVPAFETFAPLLLPVTIDAGTGQDSLDFTTFAYGGAYPFKAHVSLVFTSETQGTLESLLEPGFRVNDRTLVNFDGLEDFHLHGASDLAITGTIFDEATWSPSSAAGVGGTFSLAYAGITKTIAFDGLLTSISTLQRLTLVTAAGADRVTLTSSGNINQLGHLTNTVGPSPQDRYDATLANIFFISLDLASSDAGAATPPSESFTLYAPGTMFGLSNLSVATGAGDDSFTIEASLPGQTLQVPYDGMTFDSGPGGFDTLTATLSNGFLGLAANTLFAAGETITHLGFEKFVLTAPNISFKGDGTNTVAWTVSDTTHRTGTALLSHGAGTPTQTLVYSGQMAFTELASLTLTTPAGADDFTLSLGSAGAPFGILSGTVGGGPISHYATFYHVANLTLDFAASDSASPANDRLTISSLIAPGLRDFTVRTGEGDDTLRLLPPVTSLLLPVRGGTFSFLAGGGQDTIEASADVSMTLNDVGLFYSGNPTGSPDRGSLLFDPGQVEVAHLTGGINANRFYVNWSHTATVDGLDGNDTFFLQAFSGTGTFRGGDGDDTFILQATSAANLDGAGIGAFVDGGSGRDTIAATGDVNFVAGDHQLERFLPKTRTTPRTSAINTFDSIENVLLTGGVHANLLDAGLFSGTSTLIGDAGVDNLIASKGGGQLYGYTTVELNGPLTAGDRGYTRDNYFLSDGTVDGATDTIYSTARLGNVVSFRYYSSPTHAGVNYTLQDGPDGAGQLVSRAGAPALRVALGWGRLSVLEGSAAADKLTGNKLQNIISGLGGNDLLVSAGVDVLLGGAGQDSFQGFTPFRYQEITYPVPDITGLAAIPSVAAHAATLRGTALHSLSGSRAEFGWLNPIASIIAAA